MYLGVSDAIWPPKKLADVVCRFALKSWAAQDSLLRTIVETLCEKWQADDTYHPWEVYVNEGQELLQGQQVSFKRPRQETDRLFMNLGGDDVIEMQHPPVPEDAAGHQRPGKPVLRSVWSWLKSYSKDATTTRWWSGLEVTHWSWSTLLLYNGPN